MRRKRGARRLKISDKYQIIKIRTCLYCLIRSYFKWSSTPSLSPFIPTITIVCGGRHLSRMQPFSLIPNLHRARTFFIFVSMTAPSGKAVTSSVGRAATFPEREGFCRETNIISGKITEIFIQFKIVRIYIIILLFLLFLPFSIDLKSENMYNNIDITL